MQKSLYIFLFYLSISCSLYSQTKNCIDFKESSLVKISALMMQIKDFEPPNYLSKKELLSIVIPEFITYSETKNKFEVALVKSYLFFNENGNDFSFGPFQMKLSFVKSILKNTPNSIIEDSRLIAIKNKRFEFNTSDIDYLNEIHTQWKLLVVFEYVNRYNYNRYSIRSLYTQYNRGGVRKKKTIFNKITCKNQSYEEWCSEFYNSLP